jgi:purine-binding chemotaxis protein CheW
MNTTAVAETATLYCTFHTAGQLLGIPLRDIKEVTTETSYTPIPHAPDIVLGYVNIRGTIILSLDSRSLLGWPMADDAENRRLVIFKSTVGPSFGLMVDEVGEIQSLQPNQIVPFRASQPPSPSSPAVAVRDDRSDLITHIGKLENQLLLILNPQKFLPLLELETSR